MAVLTTLVIVLLVFSRSSEAVSGEPSALGAYSSEATYVSQAEGQDRPECINGGAHSPCRTLMYVADSINKTGSSIKILGLNLRINSTVYFNFTTDLRLYGSPTELTCDCGYSGLVFENSQNVTIWNLNFSGCGAESQLWRNTVAAVFIYDCHDFVLESSSITGSTETGLYIRDTSGTVEIRNCLFQDNGACKTCSGSSGLAIHFIESAGWESNYTIVNCRFLNNRDDGAISYKGDSLGGGVKLLFRGNSNGNRLSIIDASIEGNCATWGGGMALEFGGNATNNQVFLSQVMFRNNNASKAGGGFDVGYTKSTSTPPINNTVYIERCNFTDNNARYGAGTAVYASHTNCAMESDHNDDTLVFKSCMWIGNVGSFGSTVDVSPHSYDTLGTMYFPHPKFIDCSFTANKTRKLAAENELINVGSFAVNAFEVLFEGTVEFYNHTFTPLHVTRGTVTFLPGTAAVFRNNEGSQGGALALFGSSLLQVLPNTTLSFINNSASGDGGAIYHSTQNHHDFISSRTCFIQNGSRLNHSAQGRPKIIFRGNRVGHKNQTGQAIYATTFLPCYFEQFSVYFTKHTVMEALQRIAIFDFGDDEKMALATSGWTFEFNKSTSTSVIPGKGVEIPLTMMDELNNTVPSVYRVVQNNMCPADRQYMISSITIKSSQEKEQCTLSLISVGFRESLFLLNLTLQKCPPGFYMDPQKEVCSCSAYSNKTAYFGINSCHDRQSNAYLSNNFWAGYDDDESLLTARCPSSFCVTRFDGEVQGVKLPNTSLPVDLQNVVCHPHRTGWLCGECEPGKTTYFHSPTYQCESERLCALGPVFYFVSEVFPIFAVFSVIALFDIRFTTGTASGLVFFAQVIDTVTIRMKWNSKEPKAIEILSIVYQVIYGLFNFDFFNFEPASFCLWKDATVLSMITFKYISVLFAFILLLGIVVFLKFCTCRCLDTKSNIFAVGKNRSIIHSMSAVLVMCYAQCTNISFQILTKAALRGAGGVTKHTVAMYGGVHYLSAKHLTYALAACFCLSTVVIIPPFLLLVYPSYLTLFSLCKLNESQPVRSMSRFFNKLKPFFDSFQGCYQDRLRFFSGVYFLGRVVILAINAFVTSTSQSIIAVEIVILLLLGMYALCHPFHCMADNINTILILLNMAMIGIFTMLAYSQDGYEEQRKVVIFSMAVRLVLLYLPILCTVANVARRIVCFYKKGRGKGTDKTEENVPEEQESSRVVIDHSYLPYQEVTMTTSEPSTEVEMSYSYRDREELLAYI